MPAARHKAMKPALALLTRFAHLGEPSREDHEGAYACGGAVASDLDDLGCRHRDDGECRRLGDIAQRGVRGQAFDCRRGD